MTKVALNKKHLFETMPVLKAVLSLAIPTVISQLITVIYNMADTFLTVGIIMAIIHYLFLDKDKIIPIKNEKQKV